MSDLNFIFHCSYKEWKMVLYNLLTEEERVYHEYLNVANSISPELRSLEKLYMIDKITLSEYTDLKYPQRRLKREAEEAQYPRPYYSEPCVICKDREAYIKCQTCSNHVCNYCISKYFIMDSEPAPLSVSGKQSVPAASAKTNDSVTVSTITSAIGEGKSPELAPSVSESSHSSRHTVGSFILLHRRFCMNFGKRTPHTVTVLPEPAYLRELRMTGILSAAKIVKEMERRQAELFKDEEFESQGSLGEDSDERSLFLNDDDDLVDGLRRSSIKPLDTPVGALMPSLYLPSSPTIRRTNSNSSVQLGRGSVNNMSTSRSSPTVTFVSLEGLPEHSALLRLVKSYQTQRTVILKYQALLDEPKHTVHYKNRIRQLQSQAKTRFLLLPSKLEAALESIRAVNIPPNSRKVLEHDVKNIRHRIEVIEKMTSLEHLQRMEKELDESEAVKATIELMNKYAVM